MTRKQQRASLEETYIPVESGSGEYWNQRLEYLLRSRSFLWNQDYLSFLVEKVWKLKKPVDILDCGCGYGFLAHFLLPLLPEESTYTGIDQAGRLIEEAGKMVQGQQKQITFVCGDFLEYQPEQHFDMVIG